MLKFAEEKILIWSICL